MTKHEAMEAYFENKIIELGGAALSFNNSQEEANSFSFVTNYSDKVRRKYVR